jgi:hypothetical protein
VDEASHAEANAFVQRHRPDEIAAWRGAEPRHERRSGMLMGMREQATVQYVGRDDAEHEMWEGHPGRVIDCGVWPSEVAVSFVNGASVCLSPDQLVEIDEHTYRVLGHRVARCLHPLRDEPIPRTNVEGHEWPEGYEPDLDGT